jgi:F0F1-type ATP synthase assembly protein I
MGWAVNSIAEAVEGSIPFLPNYLFNFCLFFITYTKQLKNIMIEIYKILVSSMAEQDTSNI